jgi:hypothetical protein
MKGLRVSGMNKVVQNMVNKYIGVRNGVLKGMIQGGRLVQNTAKANTPVDTGNLKKSSFLTWSGGKSRFKTMPQFKRQGRKTRISKRKLARLVGDHPAAINDIDTELTTGNANDLQVVIGNTAFYSLFVHEKIPKNGYRVGRDHFLTSALNASLPKIKALIEKHGLRNIK